MSGQRDIGWNHPDTARYYEAFCETHPRYRIASEVLAWHASIESDQRILDVGAGTGRTAEAILPWLGDGASIIAFEPAAAMRAAGETRVGDRRVSWTADLPKPPAQFDRILCSAGIWQMLPLDRTLRRFSALLAPDGALCFNIPSAYLGHPDGAGGGDDPWLTTLTARLAAGRSSAALPAERLPDKEQVGCMLADCGLHAESWEFRLPLTQSDWRDWLRIPVLTNPLLGRLDADERARLIDEAATTVDTASWRWEAWTGWTARRGARPLSIVLPRHQELLPVRTGAECESAQEDGYLFFPGLIDPATVLALRARVVEIIRRLGWCSQEGLVDERVISSSEAEFVALQREVLPLAEFEALRAHPAVVGALSRLFGAPPAAQQGDVCRCVFPNAHHPATPPHQDGFYHRSSSRWTVWIPLGDCPLRLGPLAVIPGSHRDGLLPHAAQYTGGPGLPVAPDRGWSLSSMRCGDVLMFHPFTVHMACPNASRNQFRLSIDCRYCAV